MTLRLRVTLAVGVIALMVVTTAVVTTRIVRGHLIEQVDNRIVNAGPGRFGAGRDPIDRRVRFDPYYIAVVVDGTLVTLATPNLSGDEVEPPVLDLADLARRAERTPQAFTAGTADGDLEYRVVVRSDGRSGAVVIGAPLDEVSAAVNRISRMSWTIAAIVLGALALIAWWVLRLGVRPVQEMTRSAADIAEHDLTARVPVRAPRTEAGELGTTLNAMLDRLESAFDERTRTEARLRRFVGDASHELRTPVQTIRGYAELYRAGALTDRDRLDDAMRRTEAEAARMGSLVDELLTLARFDQERSVASEPVDMGVLARDAVDDARVMQPQRTITLDVGDATDGLVVQGDEHHLRQVFANLLMNALSHTPVTSPIHVVIEGTESSVAVTVRDEGPGMSADDASRAFERFYRVDAARTRAAGGSGLGLAIVKSVIDHHGGSIELLSDIAAGTTVEFEIPRNGEIRGT